MGSCRHRAGRTKIHRAALHTVAGAPFSDPASGKLMQKQMEAADILLGRKTFEIFEGYWPQHAQYWPGIMEVKKYVLSKTRDSSDWENTVFLNDVEAIKKLKDTDGEPIKVWGSSELVQLLLAHNLVDELWLKTYPVLLGKGKKLFSDNLASAAFKLIESNIPPSGVIFANYARAGKVLTGNLSK